MKKRYLISFFSLFTVCLTTELQTLRSLHSDSLRLSEDINTIDEEIRLIKQKHYNRYSLEEQRDMLRNKLIQQKSRFAPPPNQHTFGKSMMKKLVANNLQVLRCSFTESNQQTESGLSTGFQVLFRIRGESSDFMRFLRAIQNDEFYYQIASVRINGNQKGGIDAEFSIGYALCE